MNDEDDKLTDPIDISARLADIERTSGAARVREAAKPKQVRSASGEWPTPDCEDCGEPIGEERLEATGALICIECAREIERKGKLYAKR